MQTCTKCNSNSPDTVTHCVNCQADLQEFSKTAVALRELKENPRVRLILLQVYDDGCPACRMIQGAYKKEDVPVLPHEGCSHANGCRCFYQPALSEIYP